MSSMVFHSIGWTKKLHNNQFLTCDLAVEAEVECNICEIEYNFNILIFFEGFDNLQSRTAHYIAFYPTESTSG